MTFSLCRPPCQLVFAMCCFMNHRTIKKNCHYKVVVVNVTHVDCLRAVKADLEMKARKNTIINNASSRPNASFFLASRIYMFDIYCWLITTFKFIKLIFLYGVNANIFEIDGKMTYLYYVNHSRLISFQKIIRRTPLLCFNKKSTIAIMILPTQNW